MFQLKVTTFILLILFCSHLAFSQEFVMPAADLERSPTLPTAPTEATYFVATTGDDNNDGRSEQSAFRTVFKAVGIAQAGDSVFIREGTYHEDYALRFQTSGTSEQPITFMSYPKEQAIIEWSGHEGGSEKENIVFDGADYIILRDLIIRKSPQQCVLLINAADHNTFINMKFLDCWGSGFQIFEGSNNVVAYSFAKGNYGGGNSDGFGSIGQGGKSDGNEFWFNVAAQNADDGFDTWKGTNTLLFGNLSFENGYNGGDGNGFKLGAEGTNAQGLIQRNIAFNNASSGFDTNLGGGNRIENNTAWGNKFLNFENSSSNEANVEANIFVNNLAAQGKIDMSGNPKQESNSWNFEFERFGFASTDPSNSAFLSLESTSPVLDKGSLNDLAYKGSAPDLGALELGLSLLKSPIFSSQP